MGEMLERMFLEAMVKVFLAGGAIALGGYFLIRWLIHHIAIHWK